jgi:hypothetical protein
VVLAAHFSLIIAAMISGDIIGRGIDVIRLGSKSLSFDHALDSFSSDHVDGVPVRRDVFFRFI